MKVLIVCSYTSGKISPFVKEQVDCLENLGVQIGYFFIVKKGIIGYVMSYIKFIKKIWHSDYDLIHAHYGLSGLLASFQFLKPVIITFHGSDINEFKNRILSRLAYRFSSFSIFVHDEMAKKAKAIKKFDIIPCGIDLSVFKLENKQHCRAILNINEGSKIILFASTFNNPVKNYALAKSAIEKIQNVCLLELKGYNREEVNFLLNASDMLLLTSISEGSPQIIKEAMACNCPIVATDVGDIKKVIGNTDGCYLTSFYVEDVSININRALTFGHRTNGREKIKHFDNNIIALNIFNIYKKVYKNYYKNQ